MDWALCLWRWTSRNPFLIWVTVISTRATCTSLVSSQDVRHVDSKNWCDSRLLSGRPSVLKYCVGSAMNYVEQSNRCCKKTNRLRSVGIERSWVYYRISNLIFYSCLWMWYRSLGQFYVVWDKFKTGCTCTKTHFRMSHNWEGVYSLFASESWSVMAATVHWAVVIVLVLWQTIGLFRLLLIFS